HAGARPLLCARSRIIAHARIQLATPFDKERRCAASTISYTVGSMRPFFMTSILLSALLAGGNAAAATAERGEQIFRKALSYTVQIKSSVTMPFSGDGKGSILGAGFVIDAARGWILTNAHVVSRSPSRVEVAFNDQDFFDVVKVWVDPYMDIAIVKVPD